MLHGVRTSIGCTSGGGIASVRRTATMQPRTHTGVCGISGSVRTVIAGSNASNSEGETFVDRFGVLYKSFMRKALMCAIGGVIAVSGTLALDVGKAHGEQQQYDGRNGGVRLAHIWNAGAQASVKPAFLESKEPAPSLSDLSQEEIETIKLFQRNTPTVVNISNIVNARTPFSMDVMQLPQGQGSGFIWDSEGHVVTNFHVIRGAASLRVSLIDQTVLPAKVIGGDPSKDIAVLQLEGPREVLKNLKPVTVGKSSTLFVGQKVYAIGNPFGLDHTLTQGIISGLNRELVAEGGPSLRNVIQTDAAINPGNSGGPLLDNKGRLIGINTAIADPSGKGSSSGIGFAIPIDTVKGLVDQILKYGRVIRPAIGITIAPPQALRQLQMEGVLILQVPPDSPAGQAGLQGISRDSYGRFLLGDVIIGINGKPVKKEGDLFDVLDSCKIGDKVTVDVLRRGTQKMSFDVVLKERTMTTSE